MGVIHFLNVKEGDCILIQHPSGNNTMIDVSNAKKILKENNINREEFNNKKGNYNRKEYPVNPNEYLKNYCINSIFRFILTHPDMDHMDGIKSMFETFNVINFWDTGNDKKIDETSDMYGYNVDDWNFYQNIRKKESNPKVLHLYTNSKGKYFNEGENGKLGGDGLFILAPTKDLENDANDSGEYNDCSYVILYKTGNKKIIFAGDSGEKTWNYILENHEQDVKDIDILFAPHHGRKTGGNYDYLDTLRPKLTLFGNAKSDYLDYASWNNRNLDHITNNQADCIILDTNGNKIKIYVTYEKFARARNKDTFYEKKYNAWYILEI